MKRKVNGFSLLEVLIALMIITGGMMGIIWLQSKALRQVHAGYYRNLAMGQAAELLDRFRACRSAAGFAQEYALVRQRIADVLPQGRCEYWCGGGRQCTVSVFWQDHGWQSLVLSSLI